MTEPRQIDAVLFDLDGTLLDTAPDMVAALNRLLIEQECEELPYEQLRPVVSHGSFGLLAAAFGAEIEPARLQELTARFLVLYSEALAVDTALFAGVSDLLNAIDDQGLPWGIVTNKPEWLTDRVLSQMGIFATAGCVVSGDSLAQRKPHPAPLRHAAGLLNSNPANCIYVGDAERDIQAGRAAGMLTLVATYGYIQDHESPEDWQADGSLQHPLDLQQWLPGASSN
ncbi:MAG: phosphoglycolate phosphatase [Gammaproteobacteria bacterium]|nr:phosphoglycolate phosphatase [Gammaproteobacteria bacterium]MDH3768711.1 phosphoglycolate phosphatase [Gammaproteobacteria bacterium]